MQRHARIVYGDLDASLRVTIANGPITVAPTVEIRGAFTSDDDAAELSGNATLATAPGTTTAAAGYSQADRRALACTTANMKRGDLIWITATTGRRELATVAAITSASACVLEHDLAYDYPSGSAVAFAEVTLAIDDAWIADEANLNAQGEPYRVLWEWNDENGTNCRLLTTFDLVRVEPSVDISDDDLADLWLDLQYQTTSDQRRRLVREARKRVEIDLEARGHDPAEAVTGDKRADLIKRAVRVLMAEQGISAAGRDVETFLRDMKRDYLTQMDVISNRLERINARGDGETKEAASPLGFCS